MPCIAQSAFRKSRAVVDYNDREEAEATVNFSAYIYALGQTMQRAWAGIDIAMCRHISTGLISSAPTCQCCLEISGSYPCDKKYSRWATS